MLHVCFPFGLVQVNISQKRFLSINTPGKRIFFPNGEDCTEEENPGFIFPFKMPTLSPDNLIFAEMLF